MGICVYLRMGFSKNVYNVICHYPHDCCLTCAGKCVEKRWSSEEDGNVQHIEKSLASAPAPTKTIDETVDV